MAGSKRKKEIAYLTREAADAWTERMELIAWFRRYSTPYWINRYSVEQLRACKAILEQPEIDKAESEE